MTKKSPIAKIIAALSIAVFTVCFISLYNPPSELTIVASESMDEKIQYIPADDPSRGRDHEGDTFSIVAYDPATGQIGGAACSCYSGTIDFLSDPIRHPSTGVLLGAIHTQAAYTSTNQNTARSRMIAGDTPAQIIAYMSQNSNDSGGNSSTRQYGIVGIDGGGNITTAGFTGSNNGFWAGDIQGFDAGSGMYYSIQGNILDTSTAGSGREDILNDMETVFINTSGTLADRLVAALQGAKRVGADNRCTNSGMSGRASFVKVLYPGDPDDNSPTIDITLYPNIAWIEPIDELQCAYDAAYPPPTCRGTVNTYPYTMSFEDLIWLKDQNNCSPASATNSWIRSRHATPTGNTGPAGASQGQLYMFVEADQGTNDSAQITSPCFDIPAGHITLMNFDYHMWGANMGTLDLSANDGGGWTSVWSLSGDQGNSWNSQQVDLSAYGGSTIRLRFDGITGGGNISDMALDNIVITSVPDYCTSEGNTTSNRGITNVNINTINNSDGPLKDVGYEDFTGISTDLEQGLSYDLNVSVNTDGNNTVFAKAWIDWNQDSDFDDAGEEYDLGSATNTGSGTTSLSPLSIAVSGSETLGAKRMRISAKNNIAPTSCETGFDGEVEDYSLNIILPVVPINCLYTVDSFPYDEGFEAGLGFWIQATGDDGDWIEQTGGTPSNNTGPSSASEGTTYLYIEASNGGTPGAIGANATAILEGPCLELSAFSSVQFSFDYHTYGNDIGSIVLEGSTEEGVWFNLFTTPGVSADIWVTETVDLSAYTQDMKLRFLGNTGISWRSDLAIDNIIATGTPISCAGGTKTWNGTTWSPSGAPNISNQVIIGGVYNTVTNGDVDACELTVNSGATLTVDTNGYLNVNGDITVNGNLIVEHQGSVVQTDDAALVTNNGTINVELTTPALDARDFMILGSPMTAEDDTMNTAYQVLNHTTANFTPYVGSPPVVGVNFHDQEFDDWSNHTGTLTPGEGYLVRPSYTAGGTYNYVYDQGTLNNGVVTYPAYFGVDKEDSPNVLSNPYASAIDADLFIGANPIVSEVYFWEHLTTPAGGIPGPLGENFSMEDISMYNLMGGTEAANDPGTSTAPNGIISTGQGFGIKANSAGNVTFNNSMRLTSGNTTLRRPIEKDRIWLTVRDSQYHMGSTTLIGFMETATSGLDQGYDSMKLGTVVSLYSHLEDGSEILGIQGRESFDTNIQIPMGFSTMIDPDSAIPYTISISGIEGSNIELATVYLVDHQENTITNLSQGDYTFLSDAATYNNRFTLQFEPEVILGTTENDLEQISIYPNPTQDILTIVSPQTEVTGVLVYDLRGRVVTEKSFTTQGTYQIDLSKLETAVYFVEITTESGTLTKRVVKQ